MLRFIAQAALATFAIASRADEPSAMPLVQALNHAHLKCEWSGNGRDQLTLAFSNSSGTPVTIAIPAGLIAANPAGADRIAVLRAAQMTVPAHAAADVTLPAVALSTRNPDATQPYRATADTEPRLDALLKFLSDKPDAPKGTAQLAAFAILEDVTFPQWLQFLEAPPAGQPPDHNHPTPAEVAQAIDAIGILKTIAPSKAFALATDGELKLRALRNPWCRTKAMQLYGINLPVSDGAVPPDLGQLLHTKPGDNCPICRQRALMQAPPSDL